MTRGIGWRAHRDPLSEPQHWRWEASWTGGTAANISFLAVGHPARLARNRMTTSATPWAAGAQAQGTARA